MSFYGFRPYVPVAKRQANATKVAAKLQKNGSTLTPVVPEGRKLAHNFWGIAWCDNLERYSDYASRLPRGRSYLRNGQVIDLKIERGVVRALVHGSKLYKVEIQIGTIAASCWKVICDDCVGSIGSLVELLQGKLSKNVMERLCREGDGLFPTPKEIKLSCSCPDWADMCKHVAAALYGAGTRLDAAPDLLFTLRGVDRADLIGATTDLSIAFGGAATNRVIADDDIAALFGIEMAPQSAPEQTKPRTPAKTVARSSAPAAVQAKAKVRASPKAKTPAPPSPAPVKPASSSAKAKPVRAAAAGKAVAKDSLAPEAMPAKKQGAAALKITKSAVASQPEASAANREMKSRREAPSKAARWIGAKARKTRT
jgi:uncharacterized Zn finger protein